MKIYDFRNCTFLKSWLVHFQRSSQIQPSVSRLYKCMEHVGVAYFEFPLLMVSCNILVLCVFNVWTASSRQYSSRAPTPPTPAFTHLSDCTRVQHTRCVSCPRNGHTKTMMLQFGFCCCFRYFLNLCYFHLHTFRALCGGDWNDTISHVSVFKPTKCSVVTMHPNWHFLS